MLDQVLVFLGLTREVAESHVEKTHRKIQCVQTSSENALSNILHMSGYEILNFLKPETIFILKVVCKDLNQLISDKVIDRYGLLLRPAAQTTIERHGMNYSQYFLQELRMSSPDVYGAQSKSTYYKIEVEVLFEDNTFRVSSQNEALQECCIWGETPETYHISITLIPEYSPCWLRESGKPLIRTFGVFNNERTFGTEWGDKVVLHDYEEIFLFLSCKENEETGKYELMAMIKDYSLEWTAIDGYLHMMDKEYADLLRVLFCIQ